MKFIRFQHNNIYILPREWWVQLL